MPRPQRFPLKLRLALMLPALAALAVGGLFFSWRVEDLAGQGATEQLASTLPTLSRLLEPDLSRSPDDLQERVQILGRDSAFRLTVVRSDGVVLADSARSPAEVAAMDNHATRPEIVEAFARGQGTSVRRSDTLREPFAYAARRVKDSAGLLHVVRIARPVSELRPLKRRFLEVLGVAALLAFVVSSAVSWRLGRALFRPLAEISSGTERLAAGELSTRLRVPDEPALGGLARQINQLVETVEEKMRELASERNRLELVGESMEDAVVVIHDDGRVRIANPAFRKLFGIDRRVEGATMLELTHLPELGSLVEHTLDGDATTELEVEIRLEGGRTLAVTSSALRDGSGVVVVMHDVTDLLMLRDIRRDFVANVSHELKTPLAAIRGYAETLDGGVEDGPTAQRFTRRIIDQCRRLEALLDDLLMLATFEGSAQVRESESVRVGPLLLEAYETLSASAEEREVSVTVNIQDDPEIDGNPEALREICSNLLDNAIKYNRIGGTVQASLETREDELVLEIADSGQGIRETALPRLFERFYRADKGRGRGEGGTGLGLAIVKHAAQLHGGRVEVESSLGMGSTFRVRLPLAG